jgi:hypothetical protein
MISLQQHNIGTISVNFDTNVYDNSGYKTSTNIITHKSRFPFKPRNIQDYVEHYPQKDIYLLQEVQGGLNDINGYINLNGIEYFYSYTKTGHLFYTDENEIPYENPIPHGCVVAFNASKYKLIGVLDINNQRSRTSKFIIFRDNNTIYAALSVHGEIISDFNERYYNRITQFYDRICDAISRLKEYYNDNIEFIISGDFNINVLKPDFNPFKTISMKKFYKHVDDYTLVINEFLDFLVDNNIYIMNIPKVTNYNVDSGYIERVDFIFLSDTIHQTLKQNNALIRLGEFYDYEKPNLEELEPLYLENDFDHSYISIN